VKTASSLQFFFTIQIPEVDTKYTVFTTTTTTTKKILAARN